MKKPGEETNRVFQNETHSTVSSQHVLQFTDWSNWFTKNNWNASMFCNKKL